MQGTLSQSEIKEPAQAPLVRDGRGAPSSLIEGQGFKVRGLAYTLDGIPLLVERIAMSYVATLLMGQPMVIGTAMYSAKIEGQPLTQWLGIGRLLLMLLLYFVLCEWLYGATPAKALLRLRVVKVNGQPCGLWAALVRGVLRLVDGFFSGIPALIVMKPPLEQRIGDKAARTMVVSSREPYIEGRRSAWSLVAALGLYLAISLGSQIGLNVLATRGDTSGEAYYYQALAVFEDGDHAQAAGLIDRALEADLPRDYLPDAYYMLGYHYLAAEDPHQATAMFELTLELDAEFHPAWLLLGHAYLQLEDWQRAQECYQRVVAVKPQSAEGYLGLAWVHLAEGDPVQAQRAVKQALEIDESSGEAHACRALAFALLGRFSEAQESLEIAKECKYPDWQWVQEQIDLMKSESREP